MTVYIDEGGGYLSPSGLPVKPVPGRHHIVLTLAQTSLVFLDIPPLKRKDLEPVIAAGLPAHFPHPLKGMVRDVLPLERGCLVFLTEAALIHQIRADWGRRCQIHMTGQNLSGREGIYCFRTPGGIDFFSLGKTLRTFRATAEEEAGIGAPDPVELPSRLSLPLFRAGKKRFPWGTLIAAPLLIPALLIPLAWKENRELRYQLALQNRTIKGLRDSTVSSSGGNYPWEEAEHLLSGAIPRAPLDLLEGLVPIFADRGRILSLVIRGDRINLQARGENALEIMGALQAGNVLTEPVLEEISRDGEGEEFTLSGKWK